MTDQQEVEWWLAYRDALDSLSSAAFFAGGASGDYRNAAIRMRDARVAIDRALALSSETSGDAR